MTVSAIRPAAGDLFDDTPATALSDDQLGVRLTGYAGQIAVLTARFLELLAEFDTRRAWSGHGILSCAHWLCWRTGMSLRTAHEHVRIAHALSTLPVLRAAFHRGELTYSKIRALTRVATPERETQLLHVATSATAAQVERVVRAMRTVDTPGGAGTTPEPTSTGRWHWNHDGTLSVGLTLTPLDGAAFLAGVVRAEYERTRTGRAPDVPRNALAPEHSVAGAQPDDEAATDQADRSRKPLWRHVPTDIAPAVRVMADTLRTTTSIPGLAPTAEVIVHTHEAAAAPAEDQEATALPVPVPDPHLDSGPALTDADTAEATCSGIVSNTGNSRGIRLWWGRRRRLPTERLAQLIVSRDHCCRYPGCERTRYLHIHHAVAWADGGTTDPDNLILLCGEHHRALHHGHFTVHAHGHQQFSFHRGDSTLIESAPAHTPPDGWRPDATVAADATVPVNGGTLDLGYTIDVLYRTWELDDQRRRGRARAA